MQQCGFSEIPFPLCALFRKYMVCESLPPCNLTRASGSKPFCRTTVCLQFRHFSPPFAGIILTCITQQAPTNLRQTRSIWRGLPYPCLLSARIADRHALELGQFLGLWSGELMRILEVFYFGTMTIVILFRASCFGCSSTVPSSSTASSTLFKSS